jgi:hypothetical protein
VPVAEAPEKQAAQDMVVVDTKLHQKRWYQAVSKPDQANPSQ